MSEPNAEPEDQEIPAASAEQDEELSWEDAMEDMARQKQMIQEQAQKTKPVAQQKAVVRPPFKVEDESQPANLKFILDIPLQLTVELGRKRLLVHDLLQLSQGAVIELTKQIGEPFEVLVNQKLVARGEVVVINERFGIRITDIISPLERVQQL